MKLEVTEAFPLEKGKAAVFRRNRKNWKELVGILTYDKQSMDYLYVSESSMKQFAFVPLFNKVFARDFGAIKVYNPETLQEEQRIEY